MERKKKNVIDKNQGHVKKREREKKEEIKNKKE